MRKGRAAAGIILTKEERSKLEELARRGKAGQAMALRCRIILECAEGKTNTQLARSLKISMPTVGKWRGRFGTGRLDGLGDAPRPGPPAGSRMRWSKTSSSKTLQGKPEHATHWSTHGMARKTGLTQNAIHRIWRTFGHKPHLQETFQAEVEREDTAEIAFVDPGQAFERRPPQAPQSRM